MTQGTASQLAIEPLTKADFDAVLRDFAAFWDDDATRERHHPIFVYELGDGAFVIRDDGVVVAYLLGFVARTSPTAYIHMVAVRRGWRRLGLASHLYRHFVAWAGRQGCRRLKATAAPGNQRSIAFHLAFGMTAVGAAAGGGVPVVSDYGGPGLDRVVFEREIDSA